MTTEQTKVQSGVRALMRLGKGAIRNIFMILRLSRKTIIVTALVASLALNVASLTTDFIFNGLSRVIGMVAHLVTSKDVTIKGKHDAQVKKLNVDLDAERIKTADLDTNLKNERRITAAYRNQIDAAEKQMDFLDKNNDELIKNNRVLKNKNTALKRDLDRARHVTFKGKKRLVSEAVQETSDGISRRVARATTRDTSSIVAESIPYLGIGAIVTFTAWDIHDACETMKDLHQLDLAFNPHLAQEEDQVTVCDTPVPNRDQILDAIKRSPSTAWNNAKQWASSAEMPSWEEAKQSGRDAWYHTIDVIKTILGL